MAEEEWEILLRQGDPSGPPGQEMVEASTRMAATVAASTPPMISPVRHRRGRRTIAAVAAIVLVPAVAAAAANVFARTGRHYAPGTENDNSEVINVCAPDFDRYVLGLPRPSDPAPEGMTWEQVAHTVIRDYRTSAGDACKPGGYGMETFETGIKDSFYGYAGRVFLCRSVRAHDAGDGAKATDNARQYAIMLERSAQLGTFADSQWKTSRDAARNGDWNVLRQDNAANGAEPCP